MPVLGVTVTERAADSPFTSSASRVLVPAEMPSAPLSSRFVDQPEGRSRTWTTTTSLSWSPVCFTVMLKTTASGGRYVFTSTGSARLRSKL